MSDPFDRMTDEQLAQQAQNGCDRAAGCLIARYLPMAASRAAGYFGPGLEQQDFVQEGLLGLWSAVRNYDPQRGASFSTFADQCVVNRIHSAVRTALSPRQAPLSDYVSISQDEEGQAVQLPGAENPEVTFIQEEDRQLRNRKMRRLLSLREWEVLEQYLKGKSYQEISEHLGVTPKAVDNALQRVRRKLQAAE
ncbi:MAG: sigma-70 family RNA polymerase sigma factor [Oscillospiraceae bacterium]|nr:sigma-70 family RNA polymerase sigma factor [Oscillospiraceae bacterium]